MIIEEKYINGVLFRTITHEESDLSTENQRDGWLETCLSCDKYDNESCTHCGCIVHSLMSMSDSECPLKKW